MKYLVSLLGVFIYSFIFSQCPTESLLYYGQNDIDQFVKNQEYILNLNEQKYKDKLFAQIIKIIQIGSKN